LERRGRTHAGFGYLERDRVGRFVSLHVVTSRVRIKRNVTT